VRDDSTLDDLLGLLEADGWTDDDGILVCPHGHPIELDGECPQGCVSPLLEMGLV
jgi:hypothetical protein